MYKRRQVDWDVHAKGYLYQVSGFLYHCGVHGSSVSVYESMVKFFLPVLT